MGSHFVGQFKSKKIVIYREHNLTMKKDQHPETNLVGVMIYKTAIKSFSPKQTKVCTESLSGVQHVILIQTKVPPR